jgi:hypothetical protein
MIAAILRAPQPTGMVYFPHMAAQKPNKKRKASLDIILSTVERGFAAVAEDIADIKSKMATKDDLAAVETRLDRRIDKLDGKLDRLDTKLTKFEEHEIDKRLQLEVRVSAIEKHLGLDKKRRLTDTIAYVAASPPPEGIHCLRKRRLAHMTGR